MHSSEEPEKQIKHRAQEMGFLACGFAKAERLSDQESQLDQWLNSGFHGSMQYMENHREMRLDPTLLVPGAKSVICFAYNYFPQSSHQNSPNENRNSAGHTSGVKTSDNTIPKIAKYAWGDDYHKVIKDKLFNLMAELKVAFPTFEGRAFVDSAPVMERQWAERAGLGWIGKNSLLLRKGVGSFFFLAEIICNLELHPDTQQTDHCGSCTACIDACPTQAIVQPQVIDSTRCISYLTIEDKQWPLESKNSETAKFNQDPNQKSVALETDEKHTLRTNFSEPLDTQNWAYGCDICQDVCPWNRFSEPHEEPQFNPREMIHWDPNQWQEALENPNRIKSQLKNSAMQRAGLKKIIPQIEKALKFKS